MTHIGPITPRRRAYLHYAANQPHQLAAMTALSLGLRAHGIWATIGTDWDAAGFAHAADFVVSWGHTPPPEGFRRLPWLALEAGHFTDPPSPDADYTERRLRFVSAGWNGLGSVADLLPHTPGPTRFWSFGIDVKPWREAGDTLLVLGQHPNDANAPGAEVVQGMRARAREYAAAKGLKMVWRPHPLIQTSAHSLAQQLETARMAYTWASTAAVESVLAGVPTVCISPDAIAAPVSTRELDARPFVGERLPWLYTLAHRNWTLDELETGAMWAHLMDGCRPRHEPEQTGHNSEARQDAG